MSSIPPMTECVKLVLFETGCYNALVSFITQTWRNLPTPGGSHDFTSTSTLWFDFKSLHWKLTDSHAYTPKRILFKRQSFVKNHRKWYIQSFNVYGWLTSVEDWYGRRRSVRKRIHGCVSTDLPERCSSIQRVDEFRKLPKITEMFFMK